MPTLSDNQIEAITDHVVATLRALGIDKSAAAEFGTLVDASIAYALGQSPADYDPESWEIDGRESANECMDSLPHIAQLLEVTYKG